MSKVLNQQNHPHLLQQPLISQGDTLPPFARILFSEIFFKANNYSAVGLEHRRTRQKIRRARTRVLTDKMNLATF